MFGLFVFLLSLLIWFACWFSLFGLFVLLLVFDCLCFVAAVLGWLRLFGLVVYLFVWLLLVGTLCYDCV